jgi:hypothetical protein
MSELRIRSESVSDADWAQPFRPPSARNDDDLFADGDDFGPVLAAAGVALGALFGLAVTVRPGRPPARADGGPPPRVAPLLAGLLATVRLGGDPARSIAATGAVLARHGAAIAAALDAASAADWPAACRLRHFDVEIACAHAGGTITCHAELLAPPRVAPPAPLPILALRHAVLALPMRIRVELAAEMRLVSSLLPLRAGQVLAIAPPVEMPLILGRHCIGRAVVTALPDGRQAAELMTIAVERLGERG